MYMPSGESRNAEVSEPMNGRDAIARPRIALKCIAR